MTDAATNISERATELRRDFDRAFAQPIRAEIVEVELLAICVGDQPYAVRLSEISGLLADKTITGIPGSAATLRGIAGFRGSILPVYDLATLLGLSVAETPRWLMFAAGAPVAFAFRKFEGQLRVSGGEILPQSARTDMAIYAREFLSTQTGVRPILHLPSVLTAIKASSNDTILLEE